MSFSKLFSEIWRDFITDGVPSSGVHDIVKADMRAWGASVEAFVSAPSVTLLTEGSEPATPSAGSAQIFADADGFPNVKRDDGSVIALAFLTEQNDL
jgi:hypothetical protein